MDEEEEMDEGLYDEDGMEKEERELDEELADVSNYLIKVLVILRDC